MSLLLDPNVAYVLLMLGMVLAILAIFAPGTGLIEIGALFMLALAGYSIFNLPINLWAFLVLVFGVFPFLLALRRSHHWAFLLISLASLITGSLFLFRNPSGGPAVDPILATIASLLTTSLLWLVARKGLDALRLQPSHDLRRLIGAQGIAVTPIAPGDSQGTVHVNGEDWTARSDVFIAVNSKVEVTGREGLFLIVKPLSESR
jgi:membrane-bound serine protease (ClpP class)